MSVVHRRASGNFHELRLVALSLARDIATNAGEAMGEECAVCWFEDRISYTF
ncbi:hypothetical protein EMEDMD4_650025 [Sinorhizobium medicae]|uniref:Uncharacterized protein n=1 Tax=Sinorhizobium medicae TaxID=110321 RepID=A0A508X952_9HYPH|nr:hypothetical protein EMEDMD4_650025 [Sinorhizobium medicae]